MSCECLDVVRMLAVNEMRSPTSPSLAVKNSASPKGWSQKWAHELSTTATYSEISTSKALPSVPWAQGVAGSNPVAPTTFRVPGFHLPCAAGQLAATSNSPTFYTVSRRKLGSERPERNQLHGSALGAYRSDLGAADEDRPFPIALPRSRRRVPAPIREPEDRKGWIRSRMCQRVGPRRVREATHQVR